MQKILINDIGYLSGNNRVPIITKIKFWQRNKLHVSIFTTNSGKEFYQKNLKNIEYISIGNFSDSTSRIFLIFEYIKRNVISLKFLNKLKNRFFVVYSLSGVLDLLIFPYFLRFFDSKFKWSVVLDNKVEIKREKPSITNILATVFFKLSLILLKKANLIFVVSDDLREYMVNKGFNKAKIVLTGNAVEVDLIKKAKKLKNIDIDCLYIGRIHEEKGIYDLLKVVEIVKKTIPKFKLAIMGVGDKVTISNFKKRIKEAKLNSNIKLLGYKSGLEKYSILKSSKVFLFLSHHESYAVALLEAVTSGLKSVAYNLPIFEKLYLNNEVILVDRLDYESAASEILKLFKKRDFKNKAGIKLLKKYSWDTIALKEMEKFYEI